MLAPLPGTDNKVTVMHRKTRHLRHAFVTVHPRLKSCRNEGFGVTLALQGDLSSAVST